MRPSFAPLLIPTFLLALCAALAACDEEVMDLPDGPRLFDAAPGEGVFNDMQPLPDSALDAGVPDALPAPDLPLPDVALPDAPIPDQTVPDTLAPDLYPTPDAPIPPLKLNITFPPRAAMLTGTKNITIKGKLAGPMTSFDKLLVNGQLVTPDAAGNFSLPLSSKWGLNIITAECHDKAGRVVNRAQSFHWSGAYYDIQPAKPVAMAVNKGATARLYQKAIDDGDRKTINDLATILEKVINNTNLDAQIPTTLVSGKVSTPWPTRRASWRWSWPAGPSRARPCPRLGCSPRGSSRWWPRSSPPSPPA